MREVFKKLWEGMLLVAFLVVCVPQTVEATQVDSGDSTGIVDVTTTGLEIDDATLESTYIAGEGTITWKPATKDSNGNVTSPAVLTLNNATITKEEGYECIYILSDTDVKVEVIGTNKIISRTAWDALYIRRLTESDELISVTLTGTGTLHMESNDSYYGMTLEADASITGGVTISAPKNNIQTNKLTVDNANVSSGALILGSALHVKSGSVDGAFMIIGGENDGDIIIDKGATLNAGFIGLYGDMQNAGELNAVVSTDEAPTSMAVHGDVTLNEVSNSYVSNAGTVTITEGATLTVPEGTTLDLSDKELSFESNSTLQVEGTVELPAGTTTEDIAKMNLTGDGAVVVAGASDTEEEKIYTTEGKELNVVAGLDFTNVGTGNGQTVATGSGYTWDATTKTLTLSGAYIDGSLNLPAGSKVVVSGINIVTGDVTVAGTVSDAFTLSGEGKITSASKKYVSHIYGEPTFTWTETEDGYTAKAAFVCQGGEDTQTVDATVKETARSTDGKVTYEAQVTFDGKEYTESKTAAIPLSKMAGVQVEDAKSKAIYKVTSATATGGTVEYVKPKSKNVKKVTIPKTITINGLTYKVTSIAAKAFKGYKKLSKVTIGNNVKTIGKEAFSGCKKLKTVKMGSKVTTIGNKAFYNCSKLTSITIPSKVTKIGKSAFEKCKKLKTVTIKTKKLTAKKVGAKAFKSIKSTATIKVPKKKYKTYKSMLYKKGVGKKATFKKI